MINATELRIGNILYSNLTKVDFAVTAEDIAYIHTKEPRVADPVLLTPEILDKAGFERGGYDCLFWHKNAGGGIVEFSGIENETGFETFGVCYNKQIDVYIKYLHQLQNLYHSLTQEELEITF